MVLEIWKAFKFNQVGPKPLSMSVVGRYVDSFTRLEC